MHKTGMVFGVFDGLHEGHKYFLSQAASRCQQLLVAVTLPEVVLKLKGKAPKQSLEERCQAISAFNPAFKTIVGDRETSSWEVLKEHKPDIIFLGYDQQQIAKDLETMGIAYSYLDSYQPEQFKSSLLN